MACLRDDLGDDSAFANVKLIVAGGYDDRVEENRVYFNQLQQLVKENSLSENVEFCLSFSDAQKLELLEACSAVTYTPSNEHFGIVPIESMAAARAVVAVRSGGPLETVVDGKTGFLCDPTPKAFAGAMARIMTEKGLSRKLGAAGRQRVRDKFTREAFGKQLDSYCQDLMLRR